MNGKGSKRRPLYDCRPDEFSRRWMETFGPNEREERATRDAREIIQDRKQFVARVFAEPLTEADR